MDDFKILLSAAIDIQNTQNKINQQIDKLKTEAIKVDIELDTQSAKKAIQQLSKSQEEAFNLSSNKRQLFNSITSYIKNNTKASSEYIIKLKEIQSQIELVDKSGLDRLRKEFKNTTSEIKSLGQTGDSVFTRLNKNIGSFLNFLGSATVVMTGVNSVRKMISEVKELDSSLVELNKVADLSGQALDNFIDKAYSMASEVARTGKEVIDATTVFKRAGYTLEESFDLAKASLVMVNVGDGISNVEEASSALIATLKGFKLSDTDAMKVLDMINETSNNAAIDFDNITEGLRRVSGTLSQTGTSIQETIGLLTGGFGSLRDIEMVSSGLIMISQRLRGIDEDGNAIDGLAPKLKKEFKEIANIDIEDANGELRSAYDIISDMADVFPKLTSKQRQYLGELAAGNRQIKVLNAIVDGWGDVENAVDKATNSEGSALLENEKVLDSIQGRINALKSSFQQLSTNTIDSSLVKSFIDIANVLVTATDKIGLFNVALAGASAYLSTKNLGISNVKYARPSSNGTNAETQKCWEKNKNYYLATA